MGCLAVTYFHMRMHTIIGATPFHDSVRDGKMWVQSAMTTKQNCLHIISKRSRIRLSGILI